MSIELIINASLPETRISLMENGEIQDLLIERPSGKGIVGNIYKGRVTRVLPGMQASRLKRGALGVSPRTAAAPPAADRSPA